MAKRIKITAGDVEAHAALNNTRLAETIWEALPFEASGSTWGDEIYFEIPVTAANEVPQETVDVGDLGYWPPGSAMCIFFGPTPMSQGDEIRPASPVTVWGKLEGDATVFRAVSSGAKVVVEKAE
jgi:hypothetical protein